jgi:lysophospholipase L1-like esterase
VAIGLSNTAFAGEPPPVVFRDGDRVVFLGDTFIERDQRYGYLETLLTAANPDKNLTFRNLGWSGDTVAGTSRSGFDPPEAGFEQLKQQILAVKPTVVLVAYGMADSFAGEPGLKEFERGLNRLLDLIATTRARVVLLSPLFHADLGPPLPDPTSHNRELALYADAIKGIAKARAAGFIDLFDAFKALANAGGPLGPRALSDNGIHLTETGYWKAAFAIARPMAPEAASQATLVLRSDGTAKSAGPISVSQVEKSPQGLQFDITDRFLPVPGPGGVAQTLGPKESPFVITLADAAPGASYELKIDGKTVALADAAAWKSGITPWNGPELAQAQALRAAILRKNDLFFYRWRPQNITYLLGFRRYEQGNNAIEIPQFDPLVAEQESLIARLKKPAAHRYLVSLVGKEVPR